MKPLSYSIILFAVSILSLGLGNNLLKVGMDRFDALTDSGVPVLRALVKSPGLPVGIALLIVQFLGTLTLFKWGWDATVVLPVLGLSFVVQALFGKWMLGEEVNATRWIGIFLIIAGVYFISRSVAPGKV